MERIGLFGGSFNPVHLGHLLVAQAAREELRLDRIFFIPASMSPFKPGVELAPAAQRLRWLRLALAGRTDCEIDEQEIARGGVSYTIETVRDYSRRFAKAKLFYLIGADHVPLLPQWRDAGELAGLVEFVVIPRPGLALAPTPTPFRSQPLRGFPLGVSASQIRERIRAGLPIDALVPQAAAEAMLTDRIYV